ncbi:hypothetical protein KL905_001663 [Ogataea polymorpha]|uniref:uncharacterized protein n=1 Tax=Ogataea polymorpha TaxID=460523 RepID=UPI0007F4A192|nr:uncharacterized protein OGAPODRAFT_94848 [Ogataea polymorpha]KAG7882961.1 hypothetical protein KL937_000134 [Ogataea polymorpha]KAG7889604.1 hypothetical protein KL908_004717 [Ogataea polymorpha]KAG7922442.1 hypothetical protein KL905_001663 [Ogataea polymorpha]KAG7940552.1 hypothetical protein KL904_000415 [Ogataea polymorpha]OBA15012.1 hypothetical protein OGAPODRAFT_94848 [Ogataea polymorpha]
MSELHELCRLRRPITKRHLEKLKEYLAAGIPATYTLEEVDQFERGVDEELPSTTTPLHLICENVSHDFTPEEEETVVSMIDELFLNGAGWCLINAKDETPGCVLERRGFHKSKYWEQIVSAGVRAEVLLRHMESNIEFIEEDEVAGYDEEPARQEQPEEKEKEHDPAGDSDTFLKTKLKYTDDALLTDRKDGVMMQWEEKLMRAGCESLFKSVEDPNNVVVLNIGFGMGIIDSMIQKKKPAKHYICEAHPDVLDKMQRDGWMDKNNVVVLKGKWQDTLPPLLNEGVFFDGIYFDTFSEQYSDMLELYDLLVGLLKPEGTFSFFNGLGADRLVCYEVYKRVVELDLENYGLKTEYTEIDVPKTTRPDAKDSVWADIYRPYWTCPVYFHPEARFM